MRILISGAAGYIARHLIPELQARSHVVIGTDQRRPPGRLQDVQWVHANLLHPGAFEWMLHEIEPDIVVNLAAQIGRVWSNDDVSKTIRRNSELTAHVARACAARDVRLLHSSSSEVYGPQPLMTEATVPRPINLYGVTKLWGEQICQLYAQPQTTIARLFMPYGPGSFPGRGQNAMHTMLWMAHHRLKFTLHRGTTRSWTWVGDTARALALLIENPHVRGPINVGSMCDEVGAEELLDLVAAVTGQSVPYEIVDPPADVSPHKRFTDDLLCALGWTPTKPLLDGMRETYEFISQYDRDGNWTGAGTEELAHA